jgi:hypothetical protein
MKRDCEQQLQWATARDVPPNALLDQETTSLREAWLAFGQLLEAAQPAPDQPLKCLSEPPGRGRRWWRLAAIVGLAASLLVAATIFWSARRTEPAGVVTAPSVEVAVSRTEPAAPAAERAPQEKPSSPVAPGSALAWDDTLDKEITVAGQAVVSADQESPLLAGASVPVRYGLEEIEKDIENSPF